MLKCKISKRILLPAIIVTMLLSIAGCSNKNEDSSRQSETTAVSSDVSTHSDATSETVLPDNTNLPISQRGCKLSEHPVSGNPGFYEIDCNGLFDNLEWVFSITMYGEKLAIVYNDKNLYSYLALLDPYSLDVTGPVLLSKDEYYSPYIYTDNRDRLVIYSMDTKQITYCNEQAGIENTFSFDEEWIGDIALSEDGDYAYYYDNSKRSIIKCTIPDGTKQPVYSIDVANADYGSVGGIFDNRYVSFSYISDNGETIYEVIDLIEHTTVYSDTKSLNILTGCGDNYCIKYSVDGTEEFLCGKQDEESQIFYFNNLSEYNYCEHTPGTSSLISYAPESGSDTSDDTIIFRGYDMESGRLMHCRPFVAKNTAYGNFFINKTYYSSDMNYMAFMPGYDKPVIIIWDLLEEDSRCQDDSSYLIPLSALSSTDSKELSELKERADAMNKRFDVNIKMADELSECPVLDYEYTQISNPIRISQALTILEDALEKYPNGMLAQLDDDMGDLLHIYLAGDIIGIDEGTISSSVGIENNIDGITFVVLDITDLYSLERTIHHEIFHAIEGHMNNIGYPFEYDSWMAINPQGFDYDYDYVANESNTSDEYIIGSENDAYFVDIYSKSFPHEDRARLMEYAMTEDEYQSRAFTYDGIANKHKYICEQLRIAFDTTGWPEKTMWEIVP